MNTGWFAVKHGITDHPLFKGRHDRLAVWIWLVDHAAWQDTEHDISGHTIIIKRGEVAVTTRHISKCTGVSRQTVRTFLKRLHSDNMINPRLTHGKTIISLCNYEKYQRIENATNPRPNPKLTQDQPLKEQINNIPVGESEKSAPNSVDEINSITSALWSIGKQYLSGHGVKSPGGIIGKWRSQAGSDSAVLAAIEAAQKSGTHDPVAYIAKVISNWKSEKPKSWAQRQDEYWALSPNERVMRDLGL